MRPVYVETGLLFTSSSAMFNDSAIPACSRDQNISIKIIMIISVAVIVLHRKTLEVFIQIESSYHVNHVDQH